LSSVLLSGDFFSVADLELGALMKPLALLNSINTRFDLFFELPKLDGKQIAQRTGPQEHR
jgi:hypothetical protein